MARPPHPDEPPESIVVQQFAGIRNTVAPERLRPGELERAINVDFDDEGQPRRRRGFTQLSDQPHHSLFNASWGTLVVRNGDLGVLNPDFSLDVLVAGIGDSPVAYVETAERVYFSSPGGSGKIASDRTVQPWGTTEGSTWLSPVVNPTDTLTPIAGRLLGPPPVATALTEYNGRIYMAQGNILWATELYAYDYVDKTRNFLQFEDDITALGSVGDGFFVGTQSKLHFLSGPFGQTRRIQAHPTGVLPGSMIKVPADTVRPESSVSRGAVLFMAKTGLCVGLDSGICYNMTQTRVTFPQAERAAAMFRMQDGMVQYVGVTDSRGTPTSNARIGDYVDAEIRRHQGD